MQACTPDRTDLVADKRAYFLLWRLPWLAIAASLPLRDSALKAGIWTTAFAQMGVACLANAAGCGRLHCFFTGPFYLLGAVSSLLRGLGKLPVPWPALGGVMFVGWLLLGRLPERLWGKYAAPPFGRADRFDRFTDRARRVLDQAQDEAHRLNHNYIGTEHLLLGLVHEREGVAARVLTERGVDLGQVRSAVERIIGRAERPPAGPIGLTPRAKRALELAVDEAGRLEHDYVGTEHLLLGLVREGEGVAVDVLRSVLGPTGLAALRRQVTDVLTGGTP
jgi:hypothetical protein